MKNWQVCVISLGMCQQQLNSCSDVQPRHTCCVRCPPRKWLTNARTPYVLAHMTAAHTAFHYELLTWRSGCTWSLCHVPLCFSPASCSLYRISEMSGQALIMLFISCFWQALMDPYTLKWIRSTNVRTTPPNNDFIALFFWEAKCPWVVVYTKFICYVYTCIGGAAHLFVL